MAEDHGLSGLLEAREQPQVEAAEDRSLGESATGSKSLEEHAEEITTRKEQISDTKETRGIEKRKRSEKENQEHERQAKAKRVYGAYSDDYLELFNQTVEDARDTSDSIPYHFNFNRSQYGFTRWVPREKDLFFAALDKYGRLDVRAVARAIGTKSEPEVQALIDALAQGLQDRYTELPRDHTLHLVPYSELPAASELSAECTEALEDCADALAHRQYMWERDQERKLLGDLWILDSDTDTINILQHLKDAKNSGQSREVKDGQAPGGTQQLEIRSKPGNLDEPEEGKELDPHQKSEQQSTSRPSQEAPRIPQNNPTAKRTTAELEAATNLLNLKPFVRLSTLFYMSSSDRDWHWETHAKPGQSPALFSTAFIDFHNLVLGILRRLVSSSIFTAMSRIRSQGRSSSLATKGYIYVEDVQAALDVLGFNYDKTNYWRGVARRCNLKVYDTPPKRSSGKREWLSHSEVERRLGTAFYKPLHEDTKIFQPAASDLEDGEESDDSASSIDVPTELSAVESRMNNREANLAAHNIYADLQDTKSSWNEELELWKMMGEEPRSKEPSVLNSSFKRPREVAAFKEEEDYVSWRDRLDYKSEWEVYSKPPENRAFRKNQRLQRRHKEASPYASSSSDELPLIDARKRMGNQKNHSSDEEEDDQEDSHSTIGQQSSASEDQGPGIDTAGTKAHSRSERIGINSDSDDLDNFHDSVETRAPPRDEGLVPERITSDVRMEDGEKFQSSSEPSSSAEDPEDSESPTGTGSASNSMSGSKEETDPESDVQMLSDAELENEEAETQEDAEMQEDAEIQEDAVTEGGAEIR